MPKKINVLYLRQAGAKIGPGGVEMVIFNSAKHIDSNQFLITVAFLRTFKTNLSSIAKLFEKTRINYFEFPGIRVFDLSQFLNLVKLIKRYKINILHCHEPKTRFYGYLLKMFIPKLKLVGTVHGWIIRGFKSILYIKIDKFLLKRFDAVITVSENLEQFANRNGIRNTHLIHNAIDINKWRPNEEDKPSEGSKKPFNIGFVGRISKEKGPLDFVRVAQRVINQDIECEFLIAGNGHEKQAMKSLIKQLNMEDKFHFCGQLDDSQLYDLYLALDLILLTSYSEGLPMSLLEASAMRVPVVATRVGGVGGLITHNYNGLLADAGDVDLMANHVLFIKSNQNVACKFRKNGRFVVETRFSLDDNVNKIELLYKQVLSNN